MGPLNRNDNNAAIPLFLLLSCSFLHKLGTVINKSLFTAHGRESGALRGAGWGVELHGAPPVKGQDMKHIVFVFAWNFVQTLVAEIKTLFPSIAGRLLL